MHGDLAVNNEENAPKKSKIEDTEGSLAASSKNVFTLHSMFNAYKMTMVQIL